MKKEPQYVEIVVRLRTNHIDDAYDMMRSLAHKVGENLTVPNAKAFSLSGTPYDEPETAQYSITITPEQR